MVTLGVRMSWGELLPPDEMADLGAGMSRGEVLPQNVAHEKGVPTLGGGQGEENPLENTLGEAADRLKSTPGRDPGEGTPVKNTFEKDSSDGTPVKNEFDRRPDVEDVEQKNALDRRPDVEFVEQMSGSASPEAREGSREKNTLDERPHVEAVEQKSRSASAEIESSRSPHSGAGAGREGIGEIQAALAASSMEPPRTDELLSEPPPRGPFLAGDGPEVPRKRPFAVRDCPPGMRIRGARPMTADQNRRGPCHAHANDEKVAPQIRRVGSGAPTTPNSRPDPHMRRPDLGPTHKGKASLGASSTPLPPVPPMAPVLPMSRNVNLAPELLSDDPRVRVKFLLYEYDNLRRRFSAEDKRKVRQPGSRKSSSRPDFRASEELKPFRPYNESIYGKVPGVEVGDHYNYRMEMFMISLHRQPQGGIDYISEGKSTFKNSQGQPLSVAVSVTASGGYADDEDMGDTIIFTGQGGNAEKGSKKESKDQELGRGNLALKNSCDLNLAVRVIRGRDVKTTQNRKTGHINNQSPSGFIYFYDGLYDVVECYQERGVNGCMVYKYKLVRQPGQGLLSEQLLLHKGAALPPQLRARGEKVLLEDIARGCEPVKIQVVGYENSDVRSLLSKNLTYISSLQFARSVPRPALLTTSGKWCNCQDLCAADSSCSCDALNGGPAYNEEGSLLWAKRLVYECGKRCRCSAKCTNKVVQKGLRYDMEIFGTKQKGWGVRSKTFIPQGSFLCEYVGEVIHSSEAEKLVQQDEYLFDLKIPESMERRFGRQSELVRPSARENDGTEGETAAKFTIDARKCGNIARFMNHSCAPNLFVQCVLYDHHNRLMPHIALFAQEHIAPYKELTYDYGYEVNTITHKNGLIKPKKCHCLAEGCRGRLY